MKLTIPSQVQLGCRTFRIRISEKILKEVNCKGQLIDKEELIRLSRRSPASMFESLVHEIMHSIFYMCALDENPGIDESKIIPMSIFFAQAIMSLGVEPVFDEIPEEEK